MRQIKTYVLRAGRMGSGQMRAFEQFGPQFLIPLTVLSVWMCRPPLAALHR
jgi:hypothetical protein